MCQSLTNLEQENDRPIQEFCYLERQKIKRHYPFIDHSYFILLIEVQRLIKIKKELIFCYNRASEFFLFKSDTCEHFGAKELPVFA